jgi:hypothetical protein
MGGIGVRGGSHLALRGQHTFTQHAPAVMLHDACESVIALLQLLERWFYGNSRGS